MERAAKGGGKSINGSGEDASSAGYTVRSGRMVGGIGVVYDAESARSDEDARKGDVNGGLLQGYLGIKSLRCDVLVVLQRLGRRLDRQYWTDVAERRKEQYESGRGQRGEHRRRRGRW